MNTINNTWHDLKERGLWPIALALLIALVAVPVLLLKPSKSDSAPPPAATAPVGAGPAATRQLAAAVRTALDGGRPIRVERPGPVRDPFVLRGAGTGASATPTARAAAAGATAKTPGSAPSAAGSAPKKTPVTSKPSGTATPTPDNSSSNAVPGTQLVSASRRPARTWTIYRARVRFGSTLARPARGDVPRLTAMPSPLKPVVLFLGVVSGGREAAFMLLGGARRSGDGTCRPRKAICTVLRLRPGQKATVVAPAYGGTQTRRFRLQLAGIATQTTSSRDVARAAFRRESPAGRCVLDLVLPLDFRPGSGTLQPSHDATSCRYRLLAAAAGARR